MGGFRLLSLSVTYIRVVAYKKSSFLFIAECHPIVWMHQNLFIHLCVDRYVNCFLVLAIKNNVAKKSYHEHLFTSLFFQLYWDKIGIHIICTKLIYIFDDFAHIYTHVTITAVKVINLDITSRSFLLPFAVCEYVYVCVCTFLWWENLT